MIKFLLSLFMILVLSGNSWSAILVMSTNGTYTTKTTLEVAATAADAAGKTIHVTSPQVVTTAIVWPTDRELVFDKGGYVTFTGSGDLNLKNYGGIIKAEWFGVVTNGTDITALLNKCIASTVGTTTVKTIITPPGTIVIDGEILVTDNVNLDFTNTIINSTKTGSDLPTRFFLIDGDNTTLENINITLPQTAQTSIGYGNAFEYKTGGTYSNSTIRNCTTRYTFRSVYGYNVTMLNTKIAGNSFVSMYRDISFNKVFGSYMTIEKNDFPIERNWTGLAGSFSQISVTAGMDLEGAESITDDIYLNHSFLHLYIDRNTIYRSNNRPVYVTNIDDLQIINNTHEGKIGVLATPGCSDDNWVVELCKNFIISGNTSNASGQNFVDLLGSSYGAVTGNVGRNIYSDGVQVIYPDLYVRNKTTGLSPEYMVTKHVTISGNTFESGIAGIELNIAQGISITGNDFKKLSTGTLKNHLIINPIAAFIIANPTFKLSNITLSNNTRDTATDSVFVNTNLSAYTEWGTISLGRSMAIESGWIAQLPNTLTQYGHSKGFYNNIELYLQVTATTTHGDTQRLYGKRAQFSTSKVHGTAVNYVDIDSVFFDSGDYLDDLKYYGYGTPVVGNVTSGNIKVVMY